MRLLLTAKLWQPAVLFVIKPLDDNNSLGKVKVKSIYLTSVVPPVTKLVSMEADGAPFTPLPLSVLRFTDI